MKHMEKFICCIVKQYLTQPPIKLYKTTEIGTLSKYVEIIWIFALCPKSVTQNK